MTWLSSDDFQDEFAPEEKTDNYDRFNWYAIRTFMPNEDKLIEAFEDKIRQHNLNDEIKEILSLKEVVIDEGKEYPVYSDELPKKSFKNTGKTVWVRLKNGSFKRIRLRTKRPFKCFIFVKMYGSLNLFRKIHSWALGFNFLGFPNPQAIMPEEIERMKGLVSSEIPDIYKYIAEKAYTIVQGPVQQFQSALGVSDQLKPDETLIEADIESGERGSAEKQMELQDSMRPDEQVHNVRQKVEISKLKINDFVYVSKIGAKGLVKEIDLDKKIVKVYINLFGRNQIMQCTEDQLEEF